MIDPADLIENTLPPPVHIENLLADQKVYGSASGIRLPPLSKDIEIDYTGLSFVIPQRVRFRYRLEGFDADWQDAGIRRNAFYTGLHPGRYRFVVLASNNDGVWSKSSAEVSFMIQPAFYQTFWFETLCVLVVVLLIWLAYAYRVTATYGAIARTIDCASCRARKDRPRTSRYPTAGFSRANPQIPVSSEDAGSSEPECPVDGIRHESG